MRSSWSTVTNRKRVWLWLALLGLYVVLVGRLYVYAEQKTCVEVGGVYLYSELTCLVPGGVAYVPLTERSELGLFWVILFGGPAIVLVPIYYFGKKLLTE
jgi:hypothetical protein